MGKIESKKYKNQCLAADSDKKIEQFQSYGYVTVSATIADSRANPYNIVDPNGYGWWAPPLDVSHGHYTILFDKTYSLQKIIIKWKLKPPKFEIMLLTKHGVWKVMLTEEPKDDIEMMVSPLEIQGVKIILLDLDQKSEGAM